MNTTRRGFLGLAAAGGLLAACGTTTPGGTAGAPASGPWEFTDDRGKLIRLPNRPQRIVTQVNAGAALVDQGITPIGVFGPRVLRSGGRDPQAGDVPADLPSVGTSWGEFDMEKYIALRPDLLVTILYGDTLWYVPDDSAARIAEKAPIAAVRMSNTPADKAIDGFTRLARALGSDVDQSAAKAEFDKASDALRAATRANPGIRAAFLQGVSQELYLAKPAYFSDLSYFTSLGVEAVNPTGGADPTWETLSWEQISKYPADLFLVDARETGLSTQEMLAYPTWARLPAVQAGQVGAWRTETPMSYRKTAAALTELATTISRAKRLG